MKNILRLSLWATLLAVSSAPAAMTVHYTVQDLPSTAEGDPVRRFHYIFNDAILAENQEVEIRFSASFFSAIFNPVGPGPAFDVVAFPVNNPPGADGLFSILALENAPSLDGPFSVDAVLLDDLPSSLPFSVNQFGLENGVLVFQEVLSSGSSTPQPAAIPEPGPSSYLMIGAIALGGVGAWRRVTNGRRLQP